MNAKTLLLALFAGLSGIAMGTPAWTTGTYAWADWQPLDNNILLGLVPVKSGTTTWTWNTPADNVTNGKLEDEATDTKILGVRDGTVLTWAFDEAKDIARIRITSQDNYLSNWNGHAYDAITVTAIEVLPFGTGEWVSLGPAVAWMGPSAINYVQGINLYATLEDSDGGILAQGVGGLRLTFGAPKRNIYNYCAEIEAAGPALEDPPGGVVFTVE